MVLHTFYWFVLILAGAPLAYYVLSLHCVISYFRETRNPSSSPSSFAPPVSILKPVRDVDREAYENFASFCRLDYPEYEILFGVADPGDPVIPLIEELQHDFPDRPIRLLVGAPQLGTSPKMNSLCRLVREAKYNLLVINDSDVRVQPSYLREAVAPFMNPRVGVVTALYRSLTNGSLASDLDSLGVPADTSAGVLVARKLGGIDFALGWTMATTKERLAEIGGFESMVDHHSDDFSLGNRIAGRGYRIELMRSPVWMVFPKEKLRDFLKHELRWSVMLKSIRPAGYFALVFTFGLPWVLCAMLISHSAAVALTYLLAYLILRLGLAWTMGVWGLGDPVVRRRIWLVPVRDLLSFGVYIASFFSHTVRWRGKAYRVHGGLLVPLVNAQENKG